MDQVRFAAKDQRLWWSVSAVVVLVLAVVLWGLTNGSGSTEDGAGTTSPDSAVKTQSPESTETGSSARPASGGRDADGSGSDEPAPVEQPEVGKAEAPSEGEDLESLAEQASDGPSGVEALDDVVVPEGETDPAELQASMKKAEATYEEQEQEENQLPEDVRSELSGATEPATQASTLDDLREDAQVLDENAASSASELTKDQP